MSTPTPDKATKTPDTPDQAGTDAAPEKNDPIFRYRTARPLESVSGPAYARGMVEQTSPAPRHDDIIAVAAAIRDSNPPAGDKAAKEAELLGVSYQKAGQVRALLGQRENALAYGNNDLVRDIDRSLEMMGYTGDPIAGATGDPGPLGRQSRSDKTIHADAPTAPDADTDTKTGGTTSAGVSGTSGTTSGVSAKTSGTDTSSKKA